MEKNTFSTMLMALLLASILLQALFNFPLFTSKGATRRKLDKVSSLGLITSDWSTSSTVYIYANGTVYPSTAPIQRNGSTYTLTDNIFTNASYGIVIQRNNMTLVGAGHTLQGPNHGGAGVLLDSINNVTIEKMNVRTFDMGIRLDASSNVTISQNNLTANQYYGIAIYLSSNNTRVLANYITNNGQGVAIYQSATNSIFANTIINTGRGIELYQSSNNIISENSITGNNATGIFITFSANNSVYHNNIINNTGQVFALNSTTSWDSGYPFGGNYWSDYAGTDTFRGVSQNITGSDGIGDTPETIDGMNKDHYPLMGPFGPSTLVGLNVTVFPTAYVGLIFENITQAGSSTVNMTQTGPPLPTGLILLGQYYNISTTATFSGKLSIRIVYDDTNLTQAQESSLQLMQWQPQACDVTGPTAGVPDGVVNMRDIGYFASKFMTTPSSPNWDPRCDVTGPTPGVPDGIVNMRDIGEAVRNFMKISQWANITTYVDTVNNIIYGEASHLSMFGVTRY